MTDDKKIEGTVSSLVYQNRENGYAVIRLLTGEGEVTAVGCLPSVSPGEELILSGRWSVHQSYGPQFRADWAQRRMPEGAEAIYRYLASGAVRHIGPAKAREIVDRFGDDTLSVIENEPARLSEIRGITPKRALEIGAWFRRQVGLRRLMEFLSRYGISPQVAMRLYRAYGDEALEVVRDNPYIAAGQDYGASFFQSDAMALALGFEKDSPKRVEAAIMFELNHNLGNGHTFLPREKLIDATARLIKVDCETAELSLDILCDCGDVVNEFTAGQNACYLTRMHEAESFVASRLLLMAGMPVTNRKDVEKLVDSVEREQGVTYAEGQRRAVSLAAEKRVIVLTGGPGTGKTTSVRGILALFDILGLKTVLCAPTGRAAKRMSELTGREASTIHRLLGAGIGDEGDVVFEHDESDPLEADAVIMDETSMVDIMLMQALLRALKTGCRLVMVGDADQLPSVGPGNVFADIIRSGIIDTVCLTEIFRQAQESRIIKNAHLINKGVTPDISENSGDFFFLSRSSREAAANTIAELFSKRLPKNMGIPSRQIQVLSPTRKNEAGTVALNKKLQEAVNPPSDGKKEKFNGEFMFREGDKVMQIRNNYDIIWKSGDGMRSGTGVYNGDIGYITEIDCARETVTVDFDGKLVSYLYEQLSELEPAYAMTVHKSQGSEYRAVILSASQGVPQLMTRGILYTAVTRAKELLIIVGEKNAVEAMVKNGRRQRRYSGLRARLNGE